MNNLIIIGAGIAAINAVKAIREVNPDVAIDLFGEEKFFPYNRIRLSKSLFDHPDEDGILLQKKDWYEANQVNLHLNVRVAGLDVAGRELILPQGKRMRYDKLLLATGARNRLPAVAAAAPGMLDTIRKLEDVQRLQRALAGKDTVLNIGGGIQGLETAWILQQHHKKVILAEIQARLFPYQLDEQAATILQGLVAGYGIQVLTHAEVAKITGDEAVAGAEMKDGRQIPCQVVLYATGIQPNIEILQGTPVKTHWGVIVNDKMQTTIEDIYAAGDVAEFEGRVYGLWNIAVAQGKTAGYNIAGRDMVYQPVVPVTTLNAYGIALFSMGDVSEDSASRTVIDEDRARHTYRRIFIANQRIIGAIVIGDTSKSPLFKTAIEQKLPIDGLERDDLTVDGILERLKTLKK